jgi:hypothetical protein
LCTDDECNAGVCEHPAKSCDDGNECTFDSCDPEIGCVNEEGACESTCCISSMDMPYCCEPEQTVCCMYLDHCCGDGEICCGEEECCLQGETCCEERECCGPNETCFHGHCCAEPDENDIDCDGIPNDEDDDIDGDGIPNDEDPCPEDADPCCGDPDPCCGDHDPCGGSPDPCCGVTCNDGDSCTDDQCVDGACWYTLNDEPGCACCTAHVAATASQTCDGCVSSGKLEGGSITVSKTVVCSGQELTFTLNGVEDSGGKKRVNCVEVPIEPVTTPTYTWRIAKPGGTVTGSGNVATVTTGFSGIYSCTFTANAPRECPPPERKIGKAAKAVKIEVIEIQNQTATPIGPGLSIPPKTNIAAAIRGTGDILLQAKLTLPVPAADLPSGTLTWTGGSEVANNQLQRTVSKSAWAKHTVRVDCSSTHYTTLVYVLGAEPTDYSPTNGTSGAHFPDNERGYATTGLSPPPVDPATGRAEGRCEIQFTIRPDALVTDANNGIFATSDIQWDVSREQQRTTWRKNGGIWTLADSEETWISDDDPTSNDEDNNPWNSNGHIYGNDIPWYYDQNVEAWVKKLNMREWVRVGLGGVSATDGTICSDYSHWHWFRSVTKGVNWAEDPTYGNEIPPGNVFWGATPIP